MIFLKVQCPTLADHCVKAESHLMTPPGHRGSSFEMLMIKHLWTDGPAHPANPLLTVLYLY